MTLGDKMTEHWFLAAMLALVGFFRILERVEVGAATFIEARKVLSQPR